MEINGEHKNESPFIRPIPIPPHTPLTKAQIELAHRNAIVHWATWGIMNRAHFSYTEGSSRWHMVLSHPGSLPQYADCSAFATGCYKWTGLPDPNKNNYKSGYTGTLLSGMKHITAGQVKPGDVVIYGPGTGTHAVVVLERIKGGSNDFWLASHGHQGCPERSQHSHMADYFSRIGKPQITFLTAF